MIPTIEKRDTFRTTHWTQVLEAAETEKDADAALSDLYLTYWSPLYAYARRRGLSPTEAEDLTQDFFARMISHQSLAGVQREGGKFRSFLLKGLERLLADQWDRLRAQKRGGGQKALSLDIEHGEACLEALALANEATPESVFEKQWVAALLKRVREQLQREEISAEKEGLFLDLQPHLQGDGVGLPYAEIANRHGMREGAIKVKVHRMRQRFGQLLREEVARTVSNHEEVEEELRYLIKVMRRD
jgi:RNA polymerase sigma-70 factor (ECF subfamily)